MLRFQRRQRTTFSKQQLDTLHDVFKHKTQYPEANERDELARLTDLDPAKIQVWFQNQRAKERKRRGISADSHWDLDSPHQNYHQQQHQHYQTQNHHHNHHQYQYSVNNQTTNGMLLPSMGQQHSEHELHCSLTGYNQSTSGANLKLRRDQFLLTSRMANEAAKSVSEGKSVSLVDYYERYCNKPDGGDFLISNQPIGHHLTSSSSSSTSTTTTSTMTTTTKATTPNQQPEQQQQSNLELMEVRSKRRRMSLAEQLSDCSSQDSGHHNTCYQDSWMSAKRELRNLAYQQEQQPESSALKFYS